MRKLIPRISLMLVGVLLIWLSGALHAPLHESRRVHDLTQAEPLENAPPIVVFSTVALGGFSGFIADLLWLRAAQLQMDGEFVELVQLAEWITRLQPRFAEGWVYHAWNLAYNMSVMFNRPEDRWRWVRHGIELLRDGGLRYNPTNPMLHRELGWLFQHKIGSTSDQAHRFYKWAWAREMEQLFGGQRRNPDFYALAQAPPTRSAVMAMRGMPELIEQLQRAGFDPFTYQWPEEDRLEEWTAIIEDHAAGDALLQHMRLRILRDQYRMDPVHMEALEIQHGPLDWRLPQAHAIYWASRGLRYATGHEAMALDRMIFQSLADAFYQGRLVHIPEEGLFLPSPNPDLWPAVMRAYDEAMERHQQPGIQRGQVFFMNNAMTVLYTYNRLTDAEALFNRLREEHLDEVTADDFETHILNQYAEHLEQLTPAQAHAFIEGMLTQQERWRRLGDEERAAGYGRLAQQAWSNYMADFQDAPGAAARGLPPLEDIRRAVQTR